MAATGRTALLSSGPGATGGAPAEGPTADEDDGQNLWWVPARRAAFPPCAPPRLVGSGKTTLVAKLQGVEEYVRGRGLEYMYFSVHDDDIDDHTRCNVWVQDGDLYHKGLQKFVLAAENVADSLALLVVDMSRPWLALDSLHRWAGVLRERVDKLRLPPETLRDLEHRLVKQFQEYVEPSGDPDAAVQRRSAEQQEEEGVVLPLGENTLTHNLGFPLVVVCTKCDAIGALEKEHDYRDEHLDFIQSHIRRFCLQHGAALVYTSVKENKNLDVLYKYLVHRLYGFPFGAPAQVVERDAVLIPAGWDNEKKISILHENLQTLKADEPFEDVIVKPPVRKFVHEKEILAEDDQVFLVKLQVRLVVQPAEVPLRFQDPSNRVPAGSPRTSNRSAAANVANVMPIQSGTKKIDPNMKGGQTSEGVLANFFNSLLTKKAGSPSPAGQPATGSSTPGTVRKSGSKLGLTDVQAELDRISNKSELDSANSTTPPNENDQS
uniref:Dynein light intermediate chain n=1 Tax=Denticeps clupeoides TaxID=299321 RepID=A0AAY4B4X6_9TELE